MNSSDFNKIKKNILSFSMIIIGSFIMAISTYMFIVPARLIPGGITGIASMVETLFSFPAQYTIALINIPLLVLAMFFLDRKLALRTIVGILCVSGFMTLFDYFGLYRFNNLEEPLISAIVSGCLSGFGIGLLLNSNATPGGTEVIGLIIQKKLKEFKISYILLTINIIIISTSALMYIFVGKIHFDEVLILLVSSIFQGFLSSRSVDLVVYGINSSVKFEIVTNQGEKVCKAILEESVYGVTIINSKGAYNQQDNTILVCIVPKLRIPKFKKILRDNDPDAFMFSIDTREVMGKNVKKTL